jgi:hypothetical protein
MMADGAGRLTRKVLPNQVPLPMLIRVAMHHARLIQTASLTSNLSPNSLPGPPQGHLT